MSAPEVESSFKVTVKGKGGPLLAVQLQDALNTIHAKGAPEWAEITVYHPRDALAGGGWSVTAKWDPDAEPEDPIPAPPVGVQLSGVFLERTIEETAAKVQADARRARETPEE